MDENEAILELIERMYPNDYESWIKFVKRAGGDPKEVDREVKEALDVASLS